MTKRMLFVSHASNLSGAPILLLNLTRSLVKHSQVEIDFLILQDGELVPEFEKIGKVHFPSKWRSRLNRILKKVVPSLHVDAVSPRLLHRYDLILLNTIVSAKFFSKLKNADMERTVLYIHELPVEIASYLGDSEVSQILEQTGSVLVPSEAVRKGLEKFRLDDSNQSKIESLHYFIPNQYSEREQSVNSEKGHRFVVGGCGQPSLRKGNDLFLETARLLFERYPDADIVFKWKGGLESSPFFRQLRRHIDLIGLNGRVIFAENTREMAPFYAEIDVLFLSSREDPYPLVVLEAASAGRPTICFENGGGAVEFVEDDAGTIVEFGRLESAVEAIMAYYRNPSLLEQHSLNAREKYLQRHADGEAIARSFLNLCFGREK